jgi:hypothetical protein
VVRGENKVIAFAGVVALVMLVAAFATPPEHAEYWYNFPGFETVYGAVGVVAFIIATNLLKKINQKEGLVDD